MPVPSAIRELRYVSGTTISTDFVDADQAAWAPPTANKMRTTAYDASGLVGEAAVDATLQDRMYGAPGNIPTIKKSELKVSTYAGSGSADTTANPIATLASILMGGLANPTTNKTDVLDSSGIHTAIKIYANNLEGFVDIGGAVLVGVRGDGKGDGRVVSVTGSGSDYLDISPALPGVPADGDAVVFAHTAYMTDGATESYADFLGIGADSKDQVNVIGCKGSFGMSGLAPGELPTFEWVFTGLDHREESRTGGGLDQLEPTQATLGNKPPVDKGVGCFHFGDAGSTTLKNYHISDFTFDPAIAYEPVPSPCGPNGIISWARVPGRPVMSFNVTLDDSDADILPGLADDFWAKTGKHMIKQFGHTAQGTMAIECQNMFIDAAPVRADVGSLAGIAVTCHADWGTTSTTELIGSSFKIHWF